MTKEETHIEAEAINTAKKVHTVFRRDMIIKGSIWFALITVAGVAAIFFYNNTGSTLQAFKEIKPGYICIGFVMMFMDMMLGSWRNHIFMQKLKAGLSHWVSFKANAANVFMGAITPVHSGAAPAQIYVYMRNGVSFLDSFAVSLINLGATLIFMPLAGLIGILVNRDESVGSLVSSLLQYGFTFFLLFLSGFLLAFLKPVLVGSFVKKFAHGLGTIFTKQKDGLVRWGQKSYDNIALYQAKCSALLQKHPLLFPVALLMTVVLYLNKYLLQYIILLGLGVSADLFQVLSIQILIQFMVYFAPSPGGSGIAEVVIAALFGKIIPDSILPIFTLLQRSFLLFFPALIGAYFVIALLRKQTRVGSKKM